MDISGISVNMNFVPFSDRVKHKHGNDLSGAIISEFALGDSSISFHREDVVGRYPLENRLQNTRSTVIAHVINGTGLITIEEREIKLSSGDTIKIDPKERFFWEGKPSLILGIASSPPWSEAFCANCE